MGHVGSHLSAVALGILQMRREGARGWLWMGVKNEHLSTEMAAGRAALVDRALPWAGPALSAYFLRGRQRVRTDLSSSRNMIESRPLLMLFETALTSAYEEFRRLARDLDLIAN